MTSSYSEKIIRVETNVRSNYPASENTPFIRHNEHRTRFGSMSLALQMLCLKASWFSFRFIAMQVFIEFEACRMMFDLVSLVVLQTS
uniref:Uncharacterized protein n=1 Tax=Caenorhabditis japonica TaxID=281687 RepID=A0A8R1I8K6_CAEJA